MNFIYKYLILAISIYGLSSCEEKQSNEEPIEEVASANIRIESKQFSSSGFVLGTMVQQPFNSTLSVSGMIHLPEKSQAVVSTLMNGTVGAVDWIDGQWVSKGTTLFTIVNPELINMQEEFLVAQSQMAYLREEYSRQQQLANENITTQKDLLKAKSELNITEAKYHSVKKKLELYGINADQLTVGNLVSSLEIKAPISGYVSEIYALRGSYLQSNTPALKIGNTNHMHLELSVLEKDASLLAKGQKISFNVQNDPSKIFTGTIHLVNKMIDENRMITIHVHIDDEASKTLIPGMYANAKIILDNKTMIALPKEAVVKSGNDYYVLKLIKKDADAYEFEQIKVQVGEENNGFVSLKDTTLDSSQYLTKGAYFMIQ